MRILSHWRENRNRTRRVTVAIIFSFLFPSLPPPPSSSLKGATASHRRLVTRDKLIVSFFRACTPLSRCGAVKASRTEDYTEKISRPTLSLSLCLFLRSRPGVRASERGERKNAKLDDETAAFSLLLRCFRAPFRSLRLAALLHTTHGTAI